MISEPALMCEEVHLVALGDSRTLLNRIVYRLIEEF